MSLKIVIVVLLITINCDLFSCDLKKPRPPVGNGWNVFAVATEEFGVKMYQEIEEIDPTSNFVFSPLSIALSLVKVAFGANNSSRLQILDTLGVRSSFSAFRWMNRDVFRIQSLLSKRGIQMRNVLELPHESRTLIMSNYMAVLLSVYQTKVSVKQKDQIPKLMADPVESETRVSYSGLLDPSLFALSNTLSITDLQFDEKQITFEKDEAYDGSKYLTQKLISNSSAGFIKKVPGLVHTVISGTFHVASIDNFVLLKIPCREKLSLEIFIPKSNNHLVATSLTNLLTNHQILIGIYQLKAMKLRVKIPKVNITSNFNLKQVLSSSQIGVKDIFSKSEADLSETSNALGISIGDFTHKNSFSFPQPRNWSLFEHIKKNGTSFKEPEKTSDKKQADDLIPVTIHHPFLFCVRDEVTGHHLFMGKMISPLI